MEFDCLKTLLKTCSFHRRPGFLVGLTSILILFFLAWVPVTADTIWGVDADSSRTAVLRDVVIVPDTTPTFYYRWLSNRRVFEFDYFDRAAPQQEDFKGYVIELEPDSLRSFRIGRMIKEGTTAEVLLSETGRAPRRGPVRPMGSGAMAPSGSDSSYTLHCLQVTYSVPSGALLTVEGGEGYPPDESALRLRTKAGLSKLPFTKLRRVVFRSHRIVRPKWSGTGSLRFGEMVSEGSNEVRIETQTGGRLTGDWIGRPPFKMVLQGLLYDGQASINLVEVDLEDVNAITFK